MSAILVMIPFINHHSSHVAVIKLFPVALLNHCRATTAGEMSRTSPNPGPPSIISMIFQAINLHLFGELPSMFHYQGIGIPMIFQFYHFGGGFLKWGYPQIIHLWIFHDISHLAIWDPPLKCLLVKPAILNPTEKRLTLSSRPTSKLHTTPSPLKA